MKKFLVKDANVYPIQVCVVLCAGKPRRVVKGIFMTCDRPLIFPVKCEMALLFFLNHDFHSCRDP